MVKIKNLDDNELRQGLSLLFTRIPNLLGIKDPINAINKADIKEMILMRFKGLSLEEIDYAFKLERYGVYESKTEHFQLFNAEYVGAVLNKFQKWMQKTRLNHNIPISKKASTNELSEEEKEIIAINGIVNCFENFKATGDIEYGRTYIYDFLYPKRVFPKHTKKFKKGIRRKAQRNLYNTKEHDRKILKVLRGIQQGEDKIATECKRIILKTLFTKLVKLNKSITELL